MRIAETPASSSVLREAPAKLNLSLRVVGRRADGYHLLDSIMVPISLFDRVRVTITPGIGCRVEIHSSGSLHIPTAENIAFRAAQLFLARTSEKARIIIELWKEIPIGTGLGGGSSDGAAVLLALDELFRTRLGPAILTPWASELGCDVPFFLHCCPARVRGTGEIVESISTCPDLCLLVACSDPGLSTADVYREYDRTLTNRGSAPIKHGFGDPLMPLAQWLVNDLETAAIRIRPAIGLLKRRVLELGAVAAAMTGSGSAVFGIWNGAEAARAAAAQLRAEGVWGRTVEIVNRRSEKLDHS